MPYPLSFMMLETKDIQSRVPYVVEKNAEKLLKFFLFSITNLLKFSSNNFFHVHLFPITSTDLK